MHPYILVTEHIVIGSYGLMLSCSVFLGFFLLKKHMRNIIQDESDFERFFLILLSSGLTGAKLLYIALNLENSTTSLFSIFQGYSSKGGIIAILISACIYCKHKSLDIHTILDKSPFIILPVLIAMKFGCFLSGDNCYGKESDLPWSMSFPHGTSPTLESVHPLPLYQILGYSLILVIIIKIKSLQRSETYLFCHFLLMMIALFFTIGFFEKKEHHNDHLTTTLVIITISTLYLHFRKYSLKKLTQTLNHLKGHRIDS